MAYPLVFTDVLATRIAEYTGRDRADVLAIVRHSGDRLPDRTADLMLANLRAHLGDETPAGRAAAQREAERDRDRHEFILGLAPFAATDTQALATRHRALPPRAVAGEMTDVAAQAPAHAAWAQFELDLDELVGSLDTETGAQVRDYVTNSGPAPQPTLRDEVESLDRRLRNQLRQDLAETGTAAAGPGLVHAQQQRADAERVFAGAVGMVQPAATDAGEPRAVAVERSARIDAVLAPAGDEPVGLALDRPTVDRWLSEADKVAEGIRGVPGSRQSAVREFGERVVGDLRKAAGNSGRQQGGTAMPDARAAFRDGLADRWVSRTGAPRVFENLPLPPELDGLAQQSWPERWEGRMVAGFAESMSERTGLPEGEVLDRVTSAAGQDSRNDRQQLSAAAQLLLPDDRAEYAAERYPGHYPAGELQKSVGDAMDWGYEQWHRTLGSDPDWELRRDPARAEDGGAAMVARGGYVADEIEKVARQSDASLQATVGIGLPPEGGRAATTGPSEDGRSADAESGNGQGGRAGPPVQQRKGGQDGRVQ